MDNEPKQNDSNISPEGSFATTKTGSQEESKGPTIGIIIIVLVLIIGGIYILTSRDTDDITPDDTQKEALLEQSSSTDINSIEQDAEATNLSDLDRELNDIEQELNQGI